MVAEPRTPISAEARGRLRVLWGQVAKDAARMEAAARAVRPALVSDAQGAFGKRADRAMEAIVRGLPGCPLFRERRSAGWRFLRPVAEPGKAGLQVMILLLNGMGRGLVEAPFGFSVSRHALGRLLDRSLFRIEPVGAIRCAHDALLALEAPECMRLHALPGFLLPAAGGAFLVSQDSAADYPLLVARTWIDRDQLHDDQQRHADAWAVLTADPDSPAQAPERRT